MAVHKITTERTTITLTAQELLQIILKDHSISGGIAEIEVNRDGDVIITHLAKIS